MKNQTHIKTKIGEAFYPLMDYQLLSINSKLILHIGCTASTEPCFIDEKEFFVRSGPSTDKLEGKKQHEYIKARF